MKTTFVLWFQGKPVKKSTDFDEVHNLRSYYKEEGFEDVIVEIID